MVNRQLTAPESIVVVGASNNLAKPGGKLFHNIKTGTFGGDLYALNPKEDQVQGLPSYRHIKELPSVELAILAIPAALCADAVRELAGSKGARAFIIVSAGFSEESEEGKRIEEEIRNICDDYGASLIGPNVIGVMTPAYQGVFTLPIPRLQPGGVDFISGSGATAVFIMEAGLQKGLTFNHVFSVGNSAQLGVEDVLGWLDESHLEGVSSPVKILYFESIRHPQKLLAYARSLIRKGCRIAAVKAGTTDAGSRAASSHTGALANSDLAVDALFRKAGIVRCYGREDLATVASVMLMPPLKGRNLAIITHAGGPAVMLTDRLAKGGMDVPHLEGPAADDLLGHLYPGSSVSNPIDMLATGNAEQLGKAIDYCEHSFNEIDGIVVIFGTPGLTPVFDVYQVLHQKIESCSKPIYPVLPSVTTAREEVLDFLSKGHLNFQDEVVLGDALTRLYQSPLPMEDMTVPDRSALADAEAVIRNAPDGFLSPESLGKVLDAGGIPRIREGVAAGKEELISLAGELGYPLVMKVVGPVHKSDVGGVELDINSEAGLLDHFSRMMGIEGATGVLLQPMAEGMELFAGAKYEPGFGHVVLCGMGGIFVEAMKDVAHGLAPFSQEEALWMIRSLRGRQIMEGSRGQEGIDMKAFAALLSKLSLLLAAFPEIAEMDLNPILGRGEELVAVDARMRIQKWL